MIPYLSIRHRSSEAPTQVPTQIPAEPSVEWRNDAPAVLGVYRVRWDDHTGQRETTNRDGSGVFFYAFWNGLDSWSEVIVGGDWRRAYKARLATPGRRLFYTGSSL